jgi:hypothetical protein
MSGPSASAVALRGAVLRAEHRRVTALATEVSRQSGYALQTIVCVGAATLTVRRVSSAIIGVYRQKRRVMAAQH